MRKIEAQMCAAVQSNKDWQSANTSVHFDEETGVSVVRLHGNKIAEVSDNDMTIFDGGWQTKTTKVTFQFVDRSVLQWRPRDGVFPEELEWFVIS